MNGVNRVVVSGLGVLSPIGNDTASYWSGLTRGVCGIDTPRLVPPELLNQKVLAEIKDFDPRNYFDDRQIVTLDRVSQVAVVAAKEAIAQAGITFDNGLSERTATIIGTGAGGLTTQDECFKRLYKEGQARVYPLSIPKLMVNAPASQITMHCGLRGPSFAVASACASATHAIGLAFQMVRAGIAECAVTGGTEACITLGTIKGWEAMRVMAPDTCRPFSIDRKGMVIGEGAGILVLETLENAKRRGATILGEIVGFGMSADARDLTAPDEGGMARAIDAALSDAKLSADQVDYINAHGTGTTANDETETRAIKRSFGDHAKKVAISSTKSMVGHALGAAGGLEAVAMIKAICDSVVPPTINYLGPDPACDLDYVPNTAREMTVDIAVSNSFAFGGLNAVLVARRFV